MRLGGRPNYFWATEWLFLQIGDSFFGCPEYQSPTIWENIWKRLYGDKIASSIIAIHDASAAIICRPDGLIMIPFMKENFAWSVTLRL